MPLPATAEHGYHAPHYHRHRHLITIAKPKIKSPYREATYTSSAQPFYYLALYDSTLFSNFFLLINMQSVMLQSSLRTTLFHQDVKLQY